LELQSKADDFEKAVEARDEKEKALTKEVAELQSALEKAKEYPVTDSLSTTKMLEKIEEENLQLRKEMEETVKKCKLKEAEMKNTLAMVGDSSSVKQLVDQLKAVSGQLKDKASENRALEEQNQLKTSEIDMLKETIEQMGQAASEPQNTSANEVELQNQVCELKNALEFLQQELLEKTMSIKEFKDVSQNTDDIEAPSIKNSASEAHGMTIFTDAVDIAEELKQKNIKLQSSNDLLSEKIVELTDELEFVREERGITGGEMADLTKENSSLKDQLRDFSFKSAEFSKLSSTRDSLVEMDTLKTELGQLKSQLSTQNVELEDFRTRENDLESLTLMVNEKNRDVGKMKLEKEMAEETLIKAESKANELELKISMLTETLSNLETKAKANEANLQKTIDDLNFELNRAWSSGDRNRVRRSVVSSQDQKQSVESNVNISCQTETDQEQEKLKKHVALIDEQAQQIKVFL